MAQWKLVRYAYGDYLITTHKTKNDAMLHVGTGKSKRVDGAYEIGGRHIVCKESDLSRFGYVEQAAADAQPQGESLILKMIQPAPAVPTSKAGEMALANYLRGNGSRHWRS